MTTRREHFSTSLSQAQSIIPETFSLFEIWEAGMGTNDLFHAAQSSNLLNLSSERRLSNIVSEGFGSRFLREPHTEATPFLKEIFGKSRDQNFLKQLNCLYAIRQHGIFFAFLIDEYWPAIRSGASSISRSDIARLIDRGLISGQLNRPWSDSVRKRVSSYVLGIAGDFGFIDQSSRAGARALLSWSPTDHLILYLAHDLHFLGMSDDEVANADEWSALGLRREDVTVFLNRLQNQHHLIVQDTGHLCRIDWKYNSREELNHVLLR